MRSIITGCDGTVPEGKAGMIPENLLAVIKDMLHLEQATRIGILQSLSIPFLYVDMDTILRFSNKQCMQMLQIDSPPEDYYGKSVSEVFYNERGRQTLIHKCIKDGDIYFNQEFIITTRKGNKLNVLANLFPLYDKEGVCFGAMGLYQDITDRRNLEKRMEEKNAYIAETAKKVDNIARSAALQAEDILQLIRQTAGSVVEQSMHLSEVDASVRQMYQAIQSIAESSAKATEISGTAGSSALDGASNVEVVVSSIEQILQIASGLKSDMDTLRQEATDIDSIMNVISDIADQTNLLALNAAIEAARAGDAGRGFAVVAGEVRKLAEKTVNATKNVSETIRQIQQSTKAGAASVDKTVSSIGRTMESTHECGNSLKQIVEYSRLAAEQIQNIAKASGDQSSFGKQIVEVVDSASSVFKDIDQRMGECLESLQRLEELIKTLDALSADLVKNL